MIYRINPKNGDRISQLGYGCMRLPSKNGRIDQAKADKLIAHAVAKGVNFFDTAYIYPGSEEALGLALQHNSYRERVFISTKLPIYLCKSIADVERIFSEELQRLQTEYIDYYFLHMLCDVPSWERLKALGIEAWIETAKREGRIRNIGFSFHGGTQAFRDLIDANDWDFCMIQYNYLDEHHQAGVEGLRYAHRCGLPVFVMEPLRGGRLVRELPKQAASVFRAADAERSLADWALRWVWNHHEVTMLLSGMSRPQDLKENLRLAGSCKPGLLTEQDLNIYAQAVAAIRRVYKVPCTGCGYCLPCPRGVDIPNCFSAYNDSFARDRLGAIVKYHQITGALAGQQTDASRCVHCHKCEQHCPQSIAISESLEAVNRRMLSPWLMPFLKVGRKVLRME